MKVVFPHPAGFRGQKRGKGGSSKAGSPAVSGWCSGGKERGQSLGRRMVSRGTYLHLGFVAQTPASQGDPCPFPSLQSSTRSLAAPVPPRSQRSRTLGSLYLSRKWDLTVALSALRWANWASLSILRSTQGTYQQPASPIPGFALPPNLSAPHFPLKNPGFPQFPPPQRSLEGENNPISRARKRIKGLGGSLNSLTVLLSPALAPPSSHARDGDSSGSIPFPQGRRGLQPVPLPGAARTHFSSTSCR